MSLDLTKTRIANLLATGLPAAKVASIVGKTPSYISQLCSADEEFQNYLTSKQQENTKVDLEQQALDGKYLAAEHALLDQVISQAASVEMRDASQALKIVSEATDRAKRRANPIHSGTVVVNQQIVSLHLPQHAIPEFLISSENEVISVGNQTLAPLPSKSVETLFASMKEKSHEQARLPGSASEGSQEALPSATHTDSLKETSNQLELF